MVEQFDGMDNFGIRECKVGYVFGSHLKRLVVSWKVGPFETVFSLVIRGTS